MLGKSSKRSFSRCHKATDTSVVNTFLAGHEVRQMAFLSPSVMNHQRFFHSGIRSSFAQLQLITSSIDWDRSPIKSGSLSAVINAPSRDTHEGERRHNTSAKYIHIFSKQSERGYWHSLEATALARGIWPSEWPKPKLVIQANRLLRKCWN